MVMLASTISISTSLFTASFVTVTLLDAELMLLKGRSTPTLGKASETPPIPGLEVVLASPSTEIPSISVCISSIAACTFALVVLPAGLNVTSEAFWSSVSICAKGTCNVPPASVSSKFNPLTSKVSFSSLLGFSPPPEILKLSTSSLRFSIAVWVSVAPIDKYGAKVTSAAAGFPAAPVNTYGFTLVPVPVTPMVELTASMMVSEPLTSKE